MWIYRGAVAVPLLMSAGLLQAADQLDKSNSSSVGLGPIWTPEAEQAAEWIGPGPASLCYVAFCLLADRGKQAQPMVSTGGLP